MVLDFQTEFRTKISESFNLCSIVRKCLCIHCIFAALEVCPIDTKALFRRCQALEQLGQFEEAYKDARKLVQVEPKNAAIQPILRRLHIVIQDKVSCVMDGMMVT